MLANLYSASAAPSEETTRETLEGKLHELAEQSWFEDLCESEHVDKTELCNKVSEQIQNFSTADNLYRLGEKYWLAKDRLSRYKKLRNIFCAVAALPPLVICGLAIALNWFNLSSGLGFLVGEFFLISLLLPLIAWVYWNTPARLAGTAAEFAKANTDIDRAMRSLTEQSIRLVIVLDFIRPCDNTVTIGDGARLSSRVEQNERITTRYRPAVELHMLRSGGAAVGITGERGTGKSELLRSFCDTSAGKATKKKGGTIGVFVAVPAAFQGTQFLALVAERLAVAVPGYRTPEKRRGLRKARLAVAGLIISVLLFVLGVYIANGKVSNWKLTDSELGNSVAGISTVIFFLCCVIFGMLDSQRDQEPNTEEPNRRKKGRSGRSGPSSQVSSSAPARARLGRDAERLMLRLKYAETLTSQGEGAISGGGMSLKLGGQRTLSAVPLTEASLVSEIKTLSDRLSRAGYRIIIGVDEMDKLEAGPATEDFLNNIKQLFAISSCSFLVSVSSSAWARFVQRGVNVRDALDSSLDAIESIGPLDFYETRSLILHRNEAMHDSEILFCYVLAGGLPREVMRCAQSLAISNRDEEGSSHTLDVLASRVLDGELDRLIDASRSAVSGWLFQDRDKMFRKLDGIKKSWDGTADCPLAVDTTSSLVLDSNTAWISSQAKSESGLIVLRLELMVEFLKVARRLFCQPEEEAEAVDSGPALDLTAPAGNGSSPAVTPHAEPAAGSSWRGDILDLCISLAGVRRLMEADPTAAHQRLAEIARQVEKEPEPAPH